LIDFHLLIMGLIFSLCIHVHIITDSVGFVVVQTIITYLFLFLVYHNCIVSFIYLHLTEPTGHFLDLTA
jgi:hypothetical protein